MAIEKLSVILELVTGNYNREAKQAADATGKIGSSAKSVTGSLGAMLGPAAIGGAILGLGKMAVAAGENADRLFDLEAQTGLSTDALQQWEFVAKAAGATTEVFSDAVKAVIKNLDGTSGATGAAAKAYEALGISVKDANDNLREGGDITAEVFEKLAGMENITARNALAQDIFGKKWEETISILDLGSEALGRLREEGKGAVVSAESLRNSDKFRETWQKFTATLAPKLNEALGKLAPSLTRIVEEAAEVIPMLESIATVIADLVGVAAELISIAGQAGDEMQRFGLILESDEDIHRQLVEIVAAEAAGLSVLELRAQLATAAITDSNTAVREGVRVHSEAAAAIGPTIAMLDRQATSHRNVATAATTQRTALINLFTAQADLLDPVRSVLLLTKERIEAEKRLVEVEADSKASAEDLALAVIEAEQAHLRLNSASAALSADQIQAFSQLLVRELGYSEEAALDLLVALGLVDAFEVNVKVNFEVANKSILDAITSTGGTSGISNTQVQVRHGGGVVAGPWGSDQLVLAQGGEGIIPLSHMRGSVTKNGPTINVYSPSNNLQQDLQYATILASVTNLVEGF